MNASRHAPTLPPRPVGSPRPSSTRMSSSATMPPARAGDARRRRRSAWRCDSSADSKPTITSDWRAVEAGRPAGLGRVEDAAVGRPQLRLHDLAHGLGAGLPRSGTRCRPWPGTSGRRWMRIHASVMTPRMPSLPITMPVGARPGAGAGQAAALPPALRREHAHRLDEVVDVGVVRGVVAARAGGDPAAERREAEALREVAQREAVRAQLVLERRAVDAGLDAGRARHRVDLEHPVEAVHGDRSRRRRPRAGSRPTRPTTRRRTARPYVPFVAHQSSIASSSASVRGWATTSGGLGNWRLKASVRSVKWAPWEWNARSHVSVRAQRGERVRDDDPRRAQLGVGQVRHRHRRDRHAEALRQVLGTLGPVGVGRLLRLQPPGPERSTRRHVSRH